MSLEGEPVLASTGVQTNAPLGKRDNSVILWQPAPRGLKTVRYFLGDDKKASLLAVSPDGKRAATRTETLFILWDLSEAGPKQRAIFEQREPGLYTLAFAPDGRTLAMSGPVDIQLFDLTVSPPTKKGRWEHGHAIWVNVLVFSPDSERLVSGGGQGEGNPPEEGSGELTLWDCAAGKHTALLPRGSKEGVNQVAFSPDGKTLVAALGRGVDIWEIDGLAVGRRSHLRDHTRDVLSVAFSPDGKVLAAAGGYVQRSRHQMQPMSGDLTLWSIAGGNYTEVLHQPTEKILSLTFSRDSRMFACAEVKVFPAGSGIALWDVASRRRYAASLDEAAQQLAFLADGKALAAFGDGPAVTLRDLDADSWSAQIGHLVDRNFYYGEWARFFPDVPYRVTFPELAPGDGFSP